MAKSKKAMGSSTPKERARKTSKKVKVAAGTKRAKSPQKVKASKAKEAPKRQAKTRKRCSALQRVPYNLLTQDLAIRFPTNHQPPASCVCTDVHTQQQ